MSDLTYSKKFFRNHIVGSQQSAQVIVPIVVDLVHPNSVIDVGCGLGAWLTVFESAGVTDILGIDVDYIDSAERMIADDKFLPIDLAKSFRIDRSFDLVICLEVAEHLPESSAGDFISSLVAIGKVILFSAAIPGQGGTNHVNEQWQDYWEYLFSTHGYELIDCFRPIIWHNNNVQIHYRQNMFLYVHKEVINNNKTISDAQEKNIGHPVSVVHPALWETEHINVLPTAGSLLRMLPGTVIRSLTTRLPGLRFFGNRKSS